ncbi:TIGR01212 family radical SAM protein [Geosporobacter ferrireducens]|uniref:TIGR01212 family radical SAM protein n=1 Tax=Geosporobacter ferrireducens TaxID=1424294 RepID=A0A1D8GMN9_9FIRM|nr:TIGR01212 family radical SAM protein [Geosporobacter ferrireducens]AOT72189.1 TIGR01212 family radical SAM protein [Geosporobacter ferrireducens]MTI56079.1 TIGR01212 family radical SAM protein [Geosporobacter ferrireducens]
METKSRYRTYSQYLREKYGEKVYKIPLNLPVTCPNRDGILGRNGCIFCGEEGTGFESLCNKISVSEQLDQNIKYIQEKYKAGKFIAFFQNFTNTYLPLSDFKGYMGEVLQDNVVEIAVSTRPDCIHDDYLEYLKDLQYRTGKNISIELGLQSVNYYTLQKINRGHTLAEFIDAMLKIKKFGFSSCVHLILNLPWDHEADVIEGAKILSALGVEQVKLHSLYIVKGTEMGRQYENGQIKLISLEEYVDRVITFLEYLDPNIVLQRIIGRAPEENTLFCNWGTSWWKIKDMIDEKMEHTDSYQGKKFNYLNGKAVKHFVPEKR